MYASTRGSFWDVIRSRYRPVPDCAGAAQPALGIPAHLRQTDGDLHLGRASGRVRPEALERRIVRFAGPGGAVHRGPDTAETARFAARARGEEARRRRGNAEHLPAFGAFDARLGPMQP